MDTKHVLNVAIDIRLACIRQKKNVCILNTEWENLKMYKVMQHYQLNRRIYIRVRHCGHRARLGESRGCVLWSKTGWSDTPLRCGSTPGLLLRTDSNSVGDERRNTFYSLHQAIRQDINDSVMTLSFCGMNIAVSGGRSLNPPHLSFNPSLWAVDEVVTAFAKVGPVVGAVVFHVYNKCK